MHLNHLPTECLLQIFRPISLMDHLLHLQLVCHRWRAIHLSTCQTSIRSLTLIGPRTFTERHKPGKPKYLRHIADEVHYHVQAYSNADCGTMNPRSRYLYLKDSLTLKEGGKSLTNFLLERFPRISTLELIEVRLSGYQRNAVCALLSGWSAGLVKLTIFFRAEKDNAADFTSHRNLMETLNKLPALRVLTLSIEQDDGKRAKLFYLDNLAHLEQLHLVSPYNWLCPELMGSFFFKSNRLLSLRRLSLGTTLFSTHDYPAALSHTIGELVFGQLTHLMLSLATDINTTRYAIPGPGIEQPDQCGLDVVNLYCSSKLEYLHLENVTFPLFKLAQHLSALASTIRHLRLNLSTSHCSRDARWSPWELPTTDGFITHRFNSVHTLHLCDSNLLHTADQCAALSTIGALFPALQRLILKYGAAFPPRTFHHDYVTSCVECRASHGVEGFSVRRASVQCKERLLNSIRTVALNSLGDMFQKLCVIYIEVQPCRDLFKQRFDRYDLNLQNRDSGEGEWKITFL